MDSEKELYKQERKERRLEIKMERKSERATGKDGIVRNSVMIFFALIFIVIGALFFLSSFFDFLSIGKMWPLFMMIPVIFMAIPLVSEGRKRAYGVLIPITILTYYTVFFIWLNFVGWDKTATTWPHFILGPGLSFILSYFAGGEWGLLIPGGILLVLGFIFFGVSNNSSIAIAVIFILIGIVIILKTVFRPPVQTDGSYDPKDDENR